MRKLGLVFAIVVCLVGVTGQASAGTDIVVTVSLASVTSVSVTPDTWVIGAVILDETDVLAVSALNDGTEPINLTITGASGEGLWTIGATTDLNQFTVEAKNGTPALTTSDSIFLTASPSATINVSSIAAGNSQDFSLEYTAPSSNTDTVGDPQGFTIVITASAA